MSYQQQQQQQQQQQVVAHPFENTERPETFLVTTHGHVILDAPHVFGVKDSSGATPIVMIPNRDSCSLTVSIPSGCAAVVTRYGKYVGIYEPGYHNFPPWYKVAYLVNTQYIPYHFHIKECPTRDNVQIKIHVDLLFHITDSYAFVYDIGPEKLEELLRASQAESVRSLVRNIKVHEAYDLRGAESEDLVKSLNDKLTGYGVHVENITISNITLPAAIAVAMQAETTFESKQTEQRKRQEFDLKVLNDNNYSLRVKQDRENERKKANEEAKKMRIFVTQDIQSLEAEMQKTFSEIQASEAAAVSKIVADGRYEAAKISAEKDRIVRETAAGGNNEVTTLLTEADKQERQA